MSPLIAPILEILGKVFDRVLPDPQKQAEMKLAVLKLAQDGELEEMKTQMSAIVAEAQSSDSWTSRARPSFMYVMYVMILMSIPMGILYVFNPAAALGVAAGLKAWLSALPEQMWTLFGVGYLGYAGARTFEKVKGVANG
jgi:hypothetical protein